MEEDMELASVRDRPSKGGVLPCGSPVCLRCHRQCGVVMAAYLSGLDETQEDENCGCPTFDAPFLRG
jgi:hypothetical protein